jgi:hypothetical protein
VADLGEGILAPSRNRPEAGLFSFFWCLEDVQMNTIKMSATPQAIRKILDELEASRASRKRAWENLQEIRWILKFRKFRWIFPI